MATQVYVSNIETVLPDNAFIYSRTDLKGKITEANRVFADISGYTVDDSSASPTASSAIRTCPKKLSPIYGNLSKAAAPGRAS